MLAACLTGLIGIAALGQYFAVQHRKTLGWQRQKAGKLVDGYAGILDRMETPDGKRYIRPDRPHYAGTGMLSEEAYTMPDDDPWGMPIVAGYLPGRDGEDLEVRSAGQDNAFGTKDDLLEFRNTGEDLTPSQHIDQLLRELHKMTETFKEGTPKPASNTK